MKKRELTQVKSICDSIKHYDEYKRLFDEVEKDIKKSVMRKKNKINSEKRSYPLP